MKDTTPIYFHSATYAYEHGELDQYHASHKANIACREAIEQAITDNYRDMPPMWCGIFSESVWRGSALPISQTS